MRNVTATSFLILALSGCATSGAGADGAEAGAEAALRLDAVKTMDGASINLDAALQRGETVALVFWQTWCGSCKTEAPAIAQAQRDHGSKIQFVGVVPGKDETVDDGEVQKTAKAWGYLFPQVRDRDLSLTRGLGVNGTPTIIVLGKDRQVLYDAHRAPDDWASFEGTARGTAGQAPGDATSGSLTPFGAEECKDGVCPLPPEGESP